MKLLNPDHRPEAAVSSDETRWNLQFPYLDVANKAIVATDGRILVALPVEIAEGETSRYLGPDDMRAARGIPPPEPEPLPDTSMRFPDWKGALPPFKQGDPGTVTIGLDARLLLKLARALGIPKTLAAAQVAITVKLENGRASPDAMLVEAAYSAHPRGTGALMPVRLHVAEAEGMSL